MSPAPSCWASAAAERRDSFVDGRQARRADGSDGRSRRPRRLQERLWLVVATVIGSSRAWPRLGARRLRAATGGRQAAFLGEHDLAALSTACLVVGLAALHARHRLTDCRSLQASSAPSGSSSGRHSRACSACISQRRCCSCRSLRGNTPPGPVIVTLLVAVALTGATYSVRAGELGFLQRVVCSGGKRAARQYAASWSQRLHLRRISAAGSSSTGRCSDRMVGQLPPANSHAISPPRAPRFPDQPPRTSLDRTRYVRAHNRPMIRSSTSSA